MASGLQKRQPQDEVAALKSTARLRARVLALLHAAAEESKLTQVEIATKLGVRKSAVNQVFNGAGNIHIDTLGEYLAAMGLEADIVIAHLGEFSAARAHRRPPTTLPLTTADRDRIDNGVLVVRAKDQNTTSAKAVRQAAETGHLATRSKTGSSSRIEIHAWS